MSSALAVVLPDAARAHAAGQDAWWLYATEVLDHWGMPYAAVTPERLPERIAEFGVVLFTVPHGQDDVAKAVADWVEAGGQAVVCAGAGAIGAPFGVRDAGDRAEAHLHVDAGTVPLHGFGGIALTAPADADVRAQWSDGLAGAGVVAVRHGRGRVVFIGADPWESIVRIQQGWPVYADGEPPADGSAPVDDGILKVDDGIALSYDLDRELPPGQEPSPDGYVATRPARRAAPIFAQPHADLWRELILHTLLDAAEERGVVLPWLHYWPAGLTAIAHLSHDSDQNKDDHAKTALDGFAEAEVAVTWCHCYPGGYSADTVAAIAAAGHEQALHYNALDEVDHARWGREHLIAQDAWGRELVGRSFVSNKNHYLRWEAWTEFYGWCEERGIEIDQSRGPSKPGNIGFPFGSCHLSYPIADRHEANRRYDVLNFPLHTQDLFVFGHESVRDVIVDRAIEQHGIAHFLFHGTNMTAFREVVDACVDLARSVRARGLPWWTSEQINRWERDRRRVRVSTDRVDNGWRVTVRADAALAGAGILLPGSPVGSAYGVEVLSAPTATTASAATVHRHGRAMVEVAVDLAVGETSLLVRTR